MKVLSVIIFTILVPTTIFLLWVLTKIGSRTTDIEEQIEIERKLKNGKK